ncbi:MAG: hypothetical protein ABSA46_07320 [Thermodesulfovibrionales bacterium]
MEKEMLDHCKKIQSKEVKIGIIGLGYAGVPRVIEFCRAGCPVTGFDIADKIRLLKEGSGYTETIIALLGSS